MNNTNMYKNVPYVINNAGNKKVLIYCLNKERKFVFRYNNISDKTARKIIDKELIFYKVRMFVKANIDLFFEFAIKFEYNDEISNSREKAAFSWISNHYTDNYEQLKNMILMEIKKRT